MMEKILRVFGCCEEGSRATAVAFTVAGYPTDEATVEILLGMQSGGIDIAEVGIPFSDPIGDGPIIQDAHATALRHGGSFQATLDIVAKARLGGLHIPVVLMGYCNCVFRYGLEKAVSEAALVGVDGFLLADLPVREAARFRSLCREAGLSYIPVVSPNMTEARLEEVCQAADSYIYVLSRMGVTGSNGGQTGSKALPDFLQRLRKFSGDTPLALGIGVSTREHFVEMESLAEGVVVGTQIIKVINQTTQDQQLAQTVGEYCAYLTGRSRALDVSDPTSKDFLAGNAAARSIREPSAPLMSPYFGGYGGQFVPELLMDTLDNLERCFLEAQDDPTFEVEYRKYHPLTDKPGSPLTEMNYADSQHDGANVWVKRDGLNNTQTTAHNLNSTLGQLLLAHRLGKKRILSETTSAKQAVMVATLCARVGLGCVLFMGADDFQHFPDIQTSIQDLGGTIVSVEQGTRAVRDAINAALQSWIADLDNSHYLPSLAIGPHPFPTIVRTFQARSGSEVRSQMIDRIGKVPDAVVVDIRGGGATAFFPAFLDSDNTILFVVDTRGIVEGMTAGAFHGSWTKLYQDEDGQVADGKSQELTGWQSYPALEPELSSWLEIGRGQIVSLLYDKRRPGISGFGDDVSQDGKVPQVASQLARKMQKGQNLLVVVTQSW